MSPRPSFPRDLGDGLVLRAATAVDAEPLATFVGDTLRAQDGDARITTWPTGPATCSKAATRRSRRPTPPW
jgi:hypothetical protein